MAFVLAEENRVRRSFEEKKQGRRDYEWILMERLPGVPLSDFWNDLSWEERKPYIDQLISYVCQLKQFRYNLIGSFSDEKCTSPAFLPPTRHSPTLFVVGTQVGCDFFDFDGGPYSSYKERR